MNIKKPAARMNKLTYNSPTFVERIRVQKNDVFLQTTTAQVGYANSTLSINSNELLVRRSTVNRTIQILVPQSLRQRIIMVLHLPPIARHPAERGMYDTQRCKFYWPHMATTVDHIVSTCPGCAGNKP